MVKGYEDNRIPLDVMWTDIEYMNKYRNFEYDTVKFAGLPDFVKDLHAKNKKYVPIIDGGFAMRPNSDYTAYNEGV